MVGPDVLPPRKLHSGRLYRVAVSWVVVAVVVNDGSLSSIKGTQQKFHEGRIIGTDLSNPDFSQFAKTFGAHGLRVKDLTNFATILKDALEADRPTIIAVLLHDRQNELIDYISWLRSDPLRKFKNKN